MRGYIVISRRVENHKTSRLFGFGFSFQRSLFIVIICLQRILADEICYIQRIIPSVCTDCLFKLLIVAGTAASRSLYKIHNSGALLHV